MLLPTSIPASAEQPITESGVKSITTEASAGPSPARVPITPGYSMVVIENAPINTHFKIRSRNGDTWSEIVELASHDAEAPDRTVSGEGSDSPVFRSNFGPVWIGEDAQEVEIFSRTNVEIDVTMLNPTIESKDAEAPRVKGARIVAGQPSIQPRSAWAVGGWATQNSGCEDGPSYASKAKAMVVHHTATTNGYSRSQVVGLLRGIYHHHVNINKWCDIGYNFIVDRFGTTWEARSGGIERPVIGGHSRGFNTETSGVALLGQHHSEAQPQATSPSAASKDALVNLSAWKLSLGGIDARSDVTLTNRSTSGLQRLASNQSHRVPAIVGHQDLGITSCPGNLTIDFVRQMPQLVAEKSVDHSAYLQKLSRTFDGRDLRSEEITYWSHILNTSGDRTVAGKFVRSQYNAGILVDELYRKALGRNADPAGRSDWTAKIRAGYPYSYVSRRFYASREFLQRHPTSPQFIDALYRSVLGREPDARGRAEWVMRLDTGQLTHNQIVSRFINASENRRQLVERLYQQALGRSADDVGLQTWTPYLASNDYFDLATIMAVSREFRS